MFEDAQDGYDYNKGRYSLSTFTLRGKENDLVIQQHKEGKYETTYKKFRINLIGLPFKIDKIEIDNEEIVLNSVSFDGQSSIEIDLDFTELHIIGV